MSAADESPGAAAGPNPGRGRTAGRGRARLARTLVVAASVVMVFALVAAYARHAAVDSDQFANRASAAVRSDAVRTLIAEKVTDDIVLRRQADLLAARPVIESATASIVGGRAFGALLRTGVRDVHRAVIDRDQATVTLTVADAGTVISAALEKLQPRIARQVRPTRRVALLERRSQALGADVADVAEAIRWLAIVLPALCLVLVAGALVAAPDRRRTAADLGVGATAAGIVVVVGLVIARSIALGHLTDPDARAAGAAVWDAFLGDLRTAGWVLAGCGAIVAAAATSLIRPVDLGETVRRLATRAAAEPGLPALRVVRALTLVAAGVVVVLEREAVVTLAVTTAGVVLIYLGVNSLLHLVQRPRDTSTEPATEAETEREQRPPRRGRALAAIGAAGLVAIVVVTFLGTGGVSTAAPRTGACNGHVELCDRPFDKVAIATTHNAMSVPLPGWFSAEQERPIAGQLADGIRGLQIDVHYGDRLRNGRVRTFFGSPEDARRQAAQDGVGPEAVDAALRIRARVGFSGSGTRGMYLCHTFCELGATPLESVLRDIDTFLVTHPEEVMVVVNQDYIEPAQFVAAVESAGLGDLVYRGPVDGDWPTLREMIDRNERIVFLAENRAGGAPWYHLAYEHAVEETPFHFSRAGELTDADALEASCRPNRGPKRAPLFLINHWVTTSPRPLPSDAAKVNAYDRLLGRVRHCETQRDHVANMIAVNFYRQGDVFRVVDTVNGIP